MGKQVNKYRHEIKYFINKLQAAELSLFLRATMYLDPNADETGYYWIRSLYFDTMDNSDYYEKVIGHNIRKKIRLRIYSITAANVKLELKNKYRNYILKETVNISPEDAKELIHGNSNTLLKYNQKASNKIFAFMHSNLYRPIVIIDYEREAFFYPFDNVRVTLDKNLRAAFSPYDLFKKDLYMIPVFNNDVVILEVKYNHMIPDFLQKLLSSFATQSSQISKYCLVRKILGK